METLIYKYTLFAVVMLALIPEVIISGKSWREGMYSAKPLHLFLSISLILNSLAWSHTIANDVDYCHKQGFYTFNVTKNYNSLQILEMHNAIRKLDNVEVGNLYHLHYLDELNRELNSVFIYFADLNGAIYWAYSIR